MMRQAAIRMAYLGVLGLLMAGGAAAEEGRLLFPNSDFEQGDLTNWRADGPAFDHQPAKGENAQYRVERFRVYPEGEYWIGTYERYGGLPGETPGDVQDDAPQGSLLSTGFVIDGPFITFLIGGGRGERLGVRLIVDGQVVRSTTGGRAEAMRRVHWNVVDYEGKKARIFIEDGDSSAWGHVNVDDFRYADRFSPALLFRNSDFEEGALHSWGGTGTAFAWQPTRGDNVQERTVGRTGAEPQGRWWIGTFEKYQGRPGEQPGAVAGDEVTGTLRSNPFTIVGPVIAFLIGGSNAQSAGVRLLVGDEVVREKYGEAEEKMWPGVWQVDDLIGEEATIEIFDLATGRWGHINADYFHWGRPELNEAQPPEESATP